MEASDIANNIWKNLGECISGIWIFKSSTEYYVDSAFQNRAVSFQGSDYDIYIWGV